jgi:hypothetical protein
MKIKNLTGTGSRTCNCANWLEHWRKYNSAGQRMPIYCPVPACLETDLIGAHVKKVESPDDNTYICPLCDTHNKTTDTLEVFCALASANVSDTCGKPRSSGRHRAAARH